VEGLERAKRALEALEYKARRRVCQGAVRTAAAEIRNNVKALTPVRTGHLRGQFRLSIRLNRQTGAVAGVIKPKPTKAQKKRGQAHANKYLHLVVAGTKPHVIKPRDAKAVAFGGVAREAVQHPGSRANPFMDRAYRQSSAPAIATFTRAFGTKLEAEARKG
jgi:HK97 gp10 family phage protein